MYSPPVNLGGGLYSVTIRDTLKNLNVPSIVCGPDTIVPSLRYENIFYM